MPDSPGTTPDSRVVAHTGRWRTLALLGVAQFMLIVDVTVVAIALPHMGADLGLSRDALTWVASAYTLTFGGLMVLGGRVADLIGPRRLVLAGLAVFTIASLTAGIADGSAILIVSRIAQGVGAAMLSPAALSSVVRLFAGEERNKALGIWSAMGGAGGAVGVLLGGVLTGGPGWPWIFFVNIPVGAVILVLLIRMLPALPGVPVQERQGVDVLGAVLITGGTGLVIYALIGAGDRGWLAPVTVGLVVAGAALYAAFVVWQRRVRSPLMDVELMTRRSVGSGTFVILMATALMVAIFFLGSFYLQDAMGHSALTTGLLFLPVAGATMLGANLAGWVMARVGGRALALGGLLLAAVGLAVPALWAGTLSMVLGLSAAAAGIGSLFLVASATALGQVEPEKSGVASGIVSTFHEFGASIGTAVVSSIAAASLMTGSGEGFGRAFGVAAMIALGAGLLATCWIPARVRTSGTTD